MSRMSAEDIRVRTDRMRYTKDKAASNLTILAIVFDVFYFVSIYKTNAGSYYYTWKIGASIVYNLLFMLAGFLASVGVKSRKTGYTGLLIALGVMQFVRIFYIPLQAHGAIISIAGVESVVMGDAQFTRVIVYLAASGVCCIAAALLSAFHNRTLAQYMRSVENTAV